MTDGTQEVTVLGSFDRQMAFVARVSAGRLGGGAMQVHEDEVSVIVYFDTTNQDPGLCLSWCHLRPTVVLPTWESRFLVGTSNETKQKLKSSHRAGPGYLDIDSAFNDMFSF